MMNDEDDEYEYDRERGADSKKKLQVAGFVDSGRKSATKLDLHVNSV